MDAEVLILRQGGSAIVQALEMRMHDLASTGDMDDQAEKLTGSPVIS